MLQQGSATRSAIEALQTNWRLWSSQGSLGRIAPAWNDSAKQFLLDGQYHQSWLTGNRKTVLVALNEKLPKCISFENTPEPMLAAHAWLCIKDLSTSGGRCPLNWSMGSGVRNRQTRRKSSGSAAKFLNWVCTLTTLFNQFAYGFKCAYLIHPPRAQECTRASWRMFLLGGNEANTRRNLIRRRTVVQHCE